MAVPILPVGGSPTTGTKRRFDFNMHALVVPVQTRACRVESGALFLFRPTHKQNKVQVKVRATGLNTRQKRQTGNQELTSQFTSQSATGPRGSRGRGPIFVLGALVLEQDQEQDDDHGAGPTPPRGGARIRCALFGGPCSAKWL